MKKIIILLPLLLLFLFLQIQLHALAPNIIRVNINTSTPDDGSTWEKPMNDLQTAINTANAGDEIWVAAGEYLPTTDLSGNTTPAIFATLTFSIEKNIFIYGGFEGGESTREQRDPVANPTILQGKNDRVGYNVYHVVYIQNSNPTLDGFTVTGGVANGTGTLENRAGGLIIAANNAETSPNIEQCIFKNNSSSSNGGAVYIASSSGGEAHPTFQRCRFDNNVSGSSGGALSIRASAKNCDPNFVNCIFFDNFGDASAGAIAISATATSTSSPKFFYCDFVKNEAALFGGAIRAVTASPINTNEINLSIINCIFYDNQQGAGAEDINKSNDVILEIVNSITDKSNCSAFGGSGCNNILYNTNPSFFDANNGDLHLQEVSPAITKGMNLYSMGSLFEIDYVAAPRPNNIDNPDIGSYQYDKNLTPPLAVDWLNFSVNADNQQIQLNWQTANEREVAFYQVEHSINGRSFNKIGQIIAQNNKGINDYLFRHDNAKHGRNYYRIVQVESTGKLELSKVLPVNFNDKNAVSIYPNPVSDVLFINNHNSTLQLFDYQGFKIKSIPVMDAKTDVSTLANGIYFLKSMDGVFYKKFIVQH